MNTDDQINKIRTCFIITPIGNNDSIIFRKAKGVIESAVKPVLEKYGFGSIKAAYEINISGMINTQIINHIIDDDLVIVNLTEKNPNVMYELCLRHVVAKPIIHICENGTVLPFDIKDSRTIFYTDDMLGVEELKNNIRLFMDEMDYSGEYRDNPIYNATKTQHLLKELDDSKTVDVAEREMLKQILEILSKKDREGDHLIKEHVMCELYIETEMPDEDIVEIICNLVPSAVVVISHYKEQNRICQVKVESVATISSIVHALRIRGVRVKEKTLKKVI